MAFWRKDRGLVGEDTVDDGISGIDEAGEKQQDGAIVSHELHPGELSFEDDVAGGSGRHLGVASTTFLMYINEHSCLPTRVSGSS